MKDLKVVIVGSGIGGLTAALALASDGHEITVLEGAQKFEDVGIYILVEVAFRSLTRSRPDRGWNPCAA